VIGYCVCRPGTSRGLDMTPTSGPHGCCDSALDSDESTAVLGSRCSLATAGGVPSDLGDVIKSRDESSTAVCYFNPIYSPVRHFRRQSWFFFFYSPNWHTESVSCA